MAASTSEPRKARTRGAAFEPVCGDLHGTRTYPQRPLIGASCAVFRNGRVLLAQRARPPLETIWSLPGGLVETGERLEEAALRELYEEVGVRARIAGFADHAEVIIHDDATIKHHFVIVAFAAQWLEGEPQPSEEALAVAWADPQDLSGLTTTDRLPEIVRKAARIAAGG